MCDCIALFCRSYTISTLSTITGNIATSRVPGTFSQSLLLTDRTLTACHVTGVSDAVEDCDTVVSCGSAKSNNSVHRSSIHIRPPQPFCCSAILVQKGTLQCWEGSRRAVDKCHFET